MKLKSIALVASALIAATGATVAHAAPDAGCGAGSCAKKAKQATEQVQASCGKKDMDAHASCAKKEAMNKAPMKKDMAKKAKSKAKKMMKPAA